ncbi:MAG: YaaA family protein, partial [Muribaculaceae bacterium]|nr:YaaA family protein [Muribaculaceae bacterium]
MIILIAESKTMEEHERPVTPDEFAAHCPAGETTADETMARVARMSPSDLAAIVKISGPMAARLLRMAYEFPNKSAGLRAIEAYTGVVFKNLDYRSLSDAQKSDTSARVRIISSLYGWLRPDDIVKPYRFDYTTRLSPDGTALCTFLQKDVTATLISEITKTGTTDVLNLLPADAAKCIDWKTVTGHAKIWKADFIEHDGSAVRSPHAAKLKAMRGQLLRAVITNRLQTPADIAAFENDIMMPASVNPDAGRITFYVWAPPVPRPLQAFRV